MNILFVSHNSFKKGTFFGGTEHLFKEIHDRSDEFGLNLYFMTPKITKKTIKWEIRNGKKVVETFTQKRTTSEPFYFGGSEYSTWFSSILVKLDIRTLHIFHHLWIPLSSIPIAKNLDLTRAHAFMLHFKKSKVAPQANTAQNVYRCKTSKNP